MALGRSHTVKGAFRLPLARLRPRPVRMWRTLGSMADEVFFMQTNRTSRILAAVGSVVAMLALVPALSAQNSGGWPAEAVSPAPLRPGDVVRIQIYREPELSGDYVVDETGTVVLPRIGPVNATDKSAESLKAQLTREYEAFLSHSSIAVTVLRRIQILGAVRNPGLYPMDATMTVGDALALAGGTTPQGNPRRLELIRGGSRLKVKLTPETPVSASPIRSGDQIYVPERSWISRNPWLISSSLGALVSLTIALTR